MAGVALVTTLTVAAAFAQRDTSGAPADSAPDTLVAGAPVVIGETELFRVHDRLGPFRAEDRAEAINRRIQDLIRSTRPGDLPLTVDDAETTTEVLSGDRVLLTVTERDAQRAGLPRTELAQRHAREIEAAVLEARRQGSARNIATGVLLAILTTVVFILLIRFGNRLHPKLLVLLESWRHTRIPSIRIQRLELLTAERITDALKTAVRLGRVVLALVLLYVYVTLVLSFFPWTRAMTPVLLGYVATPVRMAWATFVGYLPNLFFLLVIIFIVYWVIKVVRLFFREVERGTIALPGFREDWAEPTYKIVRFLVLAFAVVVAFPYLPGSSSPAFKGVSLFLGVLFSLGSSSAIANIVAGVILTYTGGFRLGDRVRIADTVGDVLEKTLLVTRVRTIKNVIVTIPNAMVLGSHIINYSTSARETGLVLNTTVTIGYDVPWRQVHELLIAAARGTEGVLDEPAPFVLQTALGDFSVAYELNAYTDRPQEMARLYSDLHQNIQDRFNEAGVEILSPTFSAVRDGNQVTLPPEHLPKGYQAPGFRLFSFGPPGGGGGAEKS